MKRFHRGSLLVLILTILAACSRSESPTVFQLKLQPGATYRTQITTEQTVEQAQQGGTQQTTTIHQMILSYSIREVAADGTIQVDSIHEQVTITQENPGGTAVRYDSANPSANQNAEAYAAIYAPIIGQPIAMQFAPNGEVTNITGLEAIIEASLGKSPAGPQREQLRQMMTDNVKQSLINDSGNLVFPNQPIQVGASWPQKNTLSNSLFTMAMDTTYTLTERKDGIATIAVKAIGTLLPGQPARMMGMEKKLTMQGDETGTVSINEATGWPIRTQIQQTFAGTLVLGEPSHSMHMTMPMTLSLIHI